MLPRLSGSSGDISVPKFANDDIGRRNQAVRPQSGRLALWGWTRGYPWDKGLLLSIALRSFSSASPGDVRIRSLESYFPFLYSSYILRVSYYTGIPGSMPYLVRDHFVSGFLTGGSVNGIMV